jgi:hypothetical protein
MPLTIIPARHVDYAWRDGAHLLGESTIDECTPDQLKMVLSREERILVRLDIETESVGWAAYRVDQLPNMRVLFVTNLWAKNAHFERFLDELKDLAKVNGCSVIRCGALEAQERLYRMKIKMRPIYTIMELGIL